MRPTIEHIGGVEHGRAIQLMVPKFCAICAKKAQIRKVERQMDDLPLLTAGAMREIEARAIKSGDTSSAVLMAHAGQAVVAAIWAKWPDLQKAPGRALVLCGPGHNGGDGYVVARLLAQAGWLVELRAAAAPASASAPAQMAALWAAHGPVQPLAELSQDRGHLLGYALIIDALFGSGLTRPFQSHADVQTALATLARAAPADGPKFVAIDLPSGLCAQSGRILGADDTGGARLVLPADLTVTFETPFLGHVLDEGPALCGEVVVAPLGRAVAQARATLAGPGWAVAVGQPDGRHLAKLPQAHKYNHGHALVLAGPFGQGGAAQLAARAALRIGAGLVTIGPPQDAMLEHALGPAAAVMQQPVENASDLGRALGDRRISAICLGPGLGKDSRATDLIAAVLDDGRPTVLDADALRLVAREADLRAGLHPKTVLTPHDGEFRALVPEIATRLHAPARTGPGYSRVDAARDAARALGGFIVLKGPATVIADPSGRVAVHGGAHRAAPDLATAGSGDVLAGMITGLMARGFAAFRASSDAVWSHAELARRFGPGLIADDLVETLPNLLADIHAADP